MTFLQIINLIKETAYAQPNVNTVVREFLDLNREDTKYSAVVIQDRDGLRDRISEQDWNTYTFHLGYVDRLRDDESNRDDIFSTGINIINNIISSIRETWFPDVEVNIIDRFQTFNQRFTASCAGVYVVLAIQVAVPDCVDGSQINIYDSFETRISQNGDYHFTPSGRPVDEINITVDVSGGGEKPEESLVETISSNGSYHYEPEEGKVFGDVDITVAVPVKTETSLVETISSNGSYHYEPSAGSVFSDVSIAVDVPEKVLKRWKSEANLDRTVAGVFIEPSDIARIGADGLSEVEVEFNYEVTNITETITSNGSYYYTDDSKYIDYVEITVAVPTTVTVTMTQAEYDVLAVKDPNTIYLING